MREKGRTHGTGGERSDYCKEVKDGTAVQGRFVGFVVARGRRQCYKARRGCRSYNEEKNIEVEVLLLADVDWIVIRVQLAVAQSSFVDRV